MAMEEAISMEPVKEKLQDLKEYIPSADELICEFGKLLSERLNPELVPIGFFTAANLLLYDLQEGVSGYTNKPIKSMAVGYAPIMYRLLHMRIPEIAMAVCPEDFASGVKEVYEDFKRESKRASS